MPVSNLTFQAVRIVRRTRTRGEDGEPITVDTVVGEVTGRFDQGMARTLRNSLVGAIRADQVAGMLYIEGGLTGTDGKELTIQYKDQIYIDGEGPFEIYDLNRVNGFSAFDHFELSLVDYRNK